MKKQIYISLCVILFAFSSAKSQVYIDVPDTIRVEGLFLDTVGTGAGGSFFGGGSSKSQYDRLKLVFWMHGLAGSSRSWSAVQAATEDQTGGKIQGYEERDVDGLSLDYSDIQHLDIFQIGGKVNERMDLWKSGSQRRDTLDVKYNYSIAHSQGGIVARAVRFKNLQDSLKYPKVARGIVTFGSPHGGAQIVNNSLRGGSLRKWIDDGCKKIAAAEIQTFLNTNFWLDAFVTNKMVNDFSSKACNGFNKTALPILVSSFLKPVSLDYSQGASSLTILNASALQDSIPKVAIVGIEAEPVLWRVLDIMTTEADTLKAGGPLTNNPFPLNDDHDLADFVNRKISSYNTKWAVHNANSHKTWYKMWGQSKIEREKAKKYEAARDWFSAANLQWKRNIGARRDSVYQDGFICHCLVDSSGYYVMQQHYVPNQSDCSSNSNHGCWVEPRLVQATFLKPSDGVILCESQEAFPGCDRIEIMNGINHMQQRNSRETKEILNELFDGQLGDYFQLKKK